MFSNSFLWGMCRIRNVSCCNERKQWGPSYDPPTESLGRNRTTLINVGSRTLLHFLLNYFCLPVRNIMAVYNVEKLSHRLKNHQCFHPGEILTAHQHVDTAEKQLDCGQYRKSFSRSAGLECIVVLTLMRNLAAVIIVGKCAAMNIFTLGRHSCVQWKTFSFEVLPDIIIPLYILKHFSGPHLLLVCNTNLSQREQWGTYCKNF